MAERRRFLAWIADVLCGLAAYVLSRWIWKNVGTGPFDQLLEELATFVAVFVLLKLLWRGLVRPRKHA